MTTTIAHDPDDPRGCIECPLFHGVPRDGGCRALDSKRGMHTLNRNRLGRFVPDPRCPLRNGGVRVVAAQAEPAPTLTPERAAILDDAAEATVRMLAAIQGQAREGEAPDQTVERIIRERDELTSARAEAERLRGEGDDIEAELLEVFGEHRADDSTISKVRTLIAWHRDEVDFIGQIELLLGLDGDPGEIPDAIRKLIEERDHLRVTIQTAIPAIRAGINALGSSEVDVRQRNAARDSLHALEAAVEGVEPPAAVLSAAELEVVRGVLLGAEEEIDDVAAISREVRAWIEAGRPLASEGKEG